MTPELEAVELLAKIFGRQYPPSRGEMLSTIEALRCAHLAGFHEGRDAALEIAQTCCKAPAIIDVIRALEPKP